MSHPNHNDNIKDKIDPSLNDNQHHGLNPEQQHKEAAPASTESPTEGVEVIREDFGVQGQSAAAVAEYQAGVPSSRIPPAARFVSQNAGKETACFEVRLGDAKVYGVQSQVIDGSAGSGNEEGGSGKDENA